MSKYFIFVLGSFILILFQDSYAQMPNYVDSSRLFGIWTFVGNLNDVSQNNLSTTNYGVTFNQFRGSGCNSVASFTQSSACSTRLETILPKNKFTNKLTISMWFKSNWSGYQKGRGVRYLAVRSQFSQTVIKIYKILVK